MMDLSTQTRQGPQERRSKPRKRVSPTHAAGNALRKRDGFSLIEVIVAMMVLAVGLLGLAAGTGWMIRTVHFGELETKRSAALQSAVETVRATGDPADGSATFGDYTVTWTVDPGDQHSRPVEFVVVGPGRVSGGGGGMPEVDNAVADTFNMRIMR